MFCGLEEFVGGRGGEERLGVHLEDEPLKQTFPASNRGIKRGFGVFQSVCSIYIELYLSDYIELEVLLHNILIFINRLEIRNNNNVCVIRDEN